MTEDELKKVPFKMVAHLAMEDCHCSTYISKDGRIGFCDHVPKKANGDFRKGYRHWHIDGKVYKTKGKFIAALADFNPNVVPINRKHYQNVVARMKHEQDKNPQATFIDLNK